MSEFTKFKIGIALALLGVLFTLQPVMNDFATVGFDLFGASLKLVWFFYATSVLLGFSVYLYALAAIREQPPRWVETAGNISYACALAVPPLYPLLWFSSVMASVLGPVLDRPLLQHVVSGLLTAASTVLASSLSRFVVRLFAKRDRIVRVDQLQAAELFHLERATRLNDTGLYDLSVLESFHAVEAALRAILESRNVRPGRAIELFDAAVAAGAASPEYSDAYHRLRAIRNATVHKTPPITSEDATTAREIAQRILAGLRRDWITSGLEDNA